MRRALQDMLMSPIRALLMRALQTQLSKYIHNIELEGLGLLGRDIILENLEIRKDVLQESLRIPTDYDFSSKGEELTPLSATPGWMQLLLAKVLANMSVSVSNLVLKYEDGDVVLSAALKCFSADPEERWMPAFADLDDPLGLLHKMVRASDLTVCLDRYCAPTPGGRRRVQAFEVPLLNRASFDVRLLASVWLVVPRAGDDGGGSGGSSGGVGDGHAGTDSGASEDDEAAEVVLSAGSVEGGGVEAVLLAMKTPPSSQGGSCRLGTGLLDQPANREGRQPETTPASSAAAAGTAAAATEFCARWPQGKPSFPNRLSSINSACQMIHEGWTRRASATHSPFYDGEKVWSRDEACEGLDKDTASTGLASGGVGGGGKYVVGAGAGEDLDAHWMMPTPIMVADILVTNLHFSLSNMQLVMIQELSDRAIAHMTRNKERGHVSPTPQSPVAGGDEPVGLDGRRGGGADDAAEGGQGPVGWLRSWWWGNPSSEENLPSREISEDREVDTLSVDEENPQLLAGALPVQGKASNFGVVSVRVQRTSLTLLEHHEPTPTQEPVEEESSEVGGWTVTSPPEAISVPVHGLGTVSVLSSSRRRRLRPTSIAPLAFAMVDVKDITVDAQLLPGDFCAATDVKVQVTSVLVSHLGPHSPSDHQLQVRTPVLTWGVEVDAADAKEREGEVRSTVRNPDPRAAGKVQRCLLEYMLQQRLVGHGDTSSLGETVESPSGERENTLPTFEDGRPETDTTSGVAQESKLWAQCVTDGVGNKSGLLCALQYRVIKRQEKQGFGLGEDSKSTKVDYEERQSESNDSGVDGRRDMLKGKGLQDSTLICHDLNLGPVHALFSNAFLARLLGFVGSLERRQEGSDQVRTKRHGGRDKEKKGATGESDKGPLNVEPFGCGDEGKAIEQGNIVGMGEVLEGMEQAVEHGQNPDNQQGGSVPIQLKKPEILSTGEAVEISAHVCVRQVCLVIEFELSCDRSLGGRDIQRSSSPIVTPVEGAHTNICVGAKVGRVAGSELPCLVFLINDVEVEGSASTSLMNTWDMAGCSLPLTGQQKKNESLTLQQVCSLTFNSLLTVQLDGKVLPLQRGEGGLDVQHTSSLPVVQPMLKELVEKLAILGGTENIPAVQRLLEAAGGRLMAEITKTALGVGTGVDDLNASNMPVASAAPLPKPQSQALQPLSILFNTSCESVSVCVSSGAAFLLLDLCYLSGMLRGRNSSIGNSTVTWTDGPDANTGTDAAGDLAFGECKAVRVDRGGMLQGVQSPHFTAAARASAWHRGVALSCTGVSVGGSIGKSSPAGLTGNARKVYVSCVDRCLPCSFAEVLLIDVPKGDISGVGLKLTVKQGVHGDVRSVNGVGTRFGTRNGEGRIDQDELKLEGELALVELDYDNVRAAKRNLVSAWKIWEAGMVAFALGASVGEDVKHGCPDPLTTSPSATCSTGGTVRKRDPVLKFDVTVLAVSLRLPFDMALQAEGVQVIYRPPDILPTGAPLPPPGDTVVEVTTDLARLLHAPQDTDSSLGNGVRSARGMQFAVEFIKRQKMVECVARCEVTLGLGRTSILLHCGDGMDIQLTPESCAAFGALLRQIIGPPSPPSSSSGGKDCQGGRPTISSSSESVTVSSPPLPLANVFEVRLTMGSVAVDFVTGPCCPSAVAATVHVGGAVMQQRSEAYGQGGPRESSIMMEFGSVDGLQWRDHRCNAPVFPHTLVAHIMAFVGGSEIDSEVLAAGQGNNSGKATFLRWLGGRKAEGARLSGRTPFSCPLVVPLLRKSGDGEAIGPKHTLYVCSTTTISSQGQETSHLKLEIEPTLLACYPPTICLILSHYTLFMRHLCRPWSLPARPPSRGDESGTELESSGCHENNPVVEIFDVNVQGCAAVILTSLSPNATGIHLRAGQVTLGPDTPVPIGLSAAAGVLNSLPSVAPGVSTRTLNHPSASPPFAKKQREQKPLTMSGYTGPVSVTFVEDWATLVVMPDQSNSTSDDHHATGASSKKRDSGSTVMVSSSGMIPEAEDWVLPDSCCGTPLCVPLELRWTIAYDHNGHCRQDFFLSSVQLYLQKHHCDLCIRVARLASAVSLPHPVPQKSRKLLPDQPPSTPAPAVAAASATVSPEFSSNTPPPELSPQDTMTGSPQSNFEGGRGGGIASPPTILRGEVGKGAGSDAVSGGTTVETRRWAENSMSLRLPLFQVVLAMGPRADRKPPVLEVDVASIRFVQGVLQIRHISVTSWLHTSMSDVVRNEECSAPQMQQMISEDGYRVLERSGPPGEDLVRAEVQLMGSGDMDQHQITIQVEPFYLHANPSMLQSLAAFISPEPLCEGSPEALEPPFPHVIPPTARSNSENSGGDIGIDSSSCQNDSNPLGSSRSGGLKGEGNDGLHMGESSARTPMLKVKLLISNVALVVSSSEDGPAMIINTPHIFLTSESWLPLHVDGECDRKGGKGKGVESRVRSDMFLRISRLSCCACSAFMPPSRSKGFSLDELKPCNSLLKPFDIDLRLMLLDSGGGGSGEQRMGIFAEDIHLSFGASHLLTLKHLSVLFAAATTAMTSALKPMDGFIAPPTIVSCTRNGAMGVGQGRVPPLPRPGDTRMNDIAILRRVEDLTDGGVGVGGGHRRGPGEMVVNSQAEMAVADEGGWVQCCFWRYWNMRRVMEVAVPHLCLERGEGGVSATTVGRAGRLGALNTLEIDISWLDPFAKHLKSAACFTVPFYPAGVPAPTVPHTQHTAAGEPTTATGARSAIVVQPSHPNLAQEWCISWRVPMWVRGPSGEDIKLSTLETTQVNSLLLNCLAVYSTPESGGGWGGGGGVGGESLIAQSQLQQSLVSVTLGVQRVRVGLLTDWSPSCSHLQPEEIVRMVLSDIEAWGETDTGVRGRTSALRGAMVVACEVQDFSNFLCVPLVSNALVKWDIATSHPIPQQNFGRINNGLVVLQSHPISSLAVELHNATISVSAIALQCLDQCLEEMTQRLSHAPAPYSSMGLTLPAAPPLTDKREVCLPWESSSRKCGTRLPSQQQQQTPRQRCKHYLVVNRTDRPVWYGQASTAEILLLAPWEDTAYSWRTIPALTRPVAAMSSSSGSAPGATNRMDRLLLLLRFALYHDPQQHVGMGDTGEEGRGGVEHVGSGSMGVWTEPVVVDEPGVCMRLLRTSGEGNGRRRNHRGNFTGEAVALPLWVAVVNKGLQTCIELYGEWTFTNHLPQQVQVTWATAFGVSDGGWRHTDLIGVKGSLNLVSDNEDMESEVSGMADSGTSPESQTYSVLSACLAFGTPSGRQEGGWLSELMMEFRIVAPDASTVVGSVGPPPSAKSMTQDQGTCTMPGGHGDRGVSNLHEQQQQQQQQRGEGEEAVIEGVHLEKTWSVTRQSEWVEAGEDGTYLALISCVSPDPNVPSLWFWCVAERHSVALSDCEACRSGAVGHQRHPGQMKIHLRPLALVLNHCTQLVSILLEEAGGIDVSTVALRGDGKGVGDQEDEDEDGIGDELTLRGGAQTLRRRDNNLRSIAAAKTKLTSKLHKIRHSSGCVTSIDSSSAVHDEGKEGQAATSTLPSSLSHQRLLVEEDQEGSQWGFPESSESMSRSWEGVECPAMLEPGGKMAVLQQPFMDYCLAVGGGSREGSMLDDVNTNYRHRKRDGKSGQDHTFHPFQIFVPGKFLAHSCKPLWLPPHRRALKENLLCPLIVVASRTSNGNRRSSNWPTLTFDIQPGLSVTNHMPLPLSLRAVFSLPQDTGTVTVKGKQMAQRSGDGDGVEEVKGIGVTAQVRAGQGMGTGRGAALNPGLGKKGTPHPLHQEDTEAPVSTPHKRSFVKVLDIPAESSQSLWQICDTNGLPAAMFFPKMSCEFGVGRGGGGGGLGVGVGEAPVMSAGKESTTREEHSDGMEEMLLADPQMVKLDEELDKLLFLPLAANAGGRDNSGTAMLPVWLTMGKELVPGGVELVRLEIRPRVLLHNATGLPITLDLSPQLQHAPGVRAFGDIASDDTLANSTITGTSPDYPTEGCLRLDLAAKGQGSRKIIVAWNRCHSSAGAGLNSGGMRHGIQQSGSGDIQSTAGSVGLLRRGLHRLIRTASGQTSSSHSMGYSVGLRFGFEGRNEDQTTGWRSDNQKESSHSGREYNTLLLSEAGEGGALHQSRSSLSVLGERGQRIIRVCVSIEEVSRTHHVLFHRDPQPALTITNNFEGVLTIKVDGGNPLTITPGATVECSWPEDASIDRSGINPNQSLQQRQSQYLSRPTIRAGSKKTSSPSVGLEGMIGGGEFGSVVGSPSSRTRLVGSSISSSGTFKGGFALRHWFQCKVGGENSAAEWSKELWVAQGVQVVGLDPNCSTGVVTDGGISVAEGESAEEDTFWGGASDRLGSERHQDVQVQVHIMELAGTFVMYLAEATFGDGVLKEGVGEGQHLKDPLESRRDLLEEWANRVEQQVMVSVMHTTVLFLDESQLLALVSAVGRVAPSGGLAEGGAQEWPGRLDRATAGSLEGVGAPLLQKANGGAAAIPGICSVYLDKGIARHWQGAPVAQLGALAMSALDVERLAHLKGYQRVDTRLYGLQVDNHAPGHKLPVVFCFQGKGQGVDSADGVGRSSGGVKQGTEEEHPVGGGGIEGSDLNDDPFIAFSMVLAEPLVESGVPRYLEVISLDCAPVDVCLEESLVPPLLHLLERLSQAIRSETKCSDVDNLSSPMDLEVIRLAPLQLPAVLHASMAPLLFVQRINVGTLVVRATVLGHIPGKQVFVALDKSRLLLQPVSLRGVFARPEAIAEWIFSNYAADAMLQSLAVVGSLQAIGSPTILLTEWGRGVYDLFSLPIRALPQGPFATLRASYLGLSSLVRHGSAGALSSVSGLTATLSRTIGGGSGVMRPIAGTMSLVHRTSQSLIASTGVNSEWQHATPAAAANPVLCHLNTDLWYRWSLLPPDHDFLYQTQAMCSHASYSRADIPVMIILSNKSIFLYRGASGCEKLWMQIEHSDITLVEQGAEHVPAELILNTRAVRRPRHQFTGISAVAVTARPGGAAVGEEDREAPLGRLGQEEVVVGDLLIKLTVLSRSCSWELARLLQGLTGLG